MYSFFLALFIGVAAGPPPALDLADEEKGLPSMSDMFEVVSEDLLQLNKNLQSVSFLILDVCLMFVAFILRWDILVERHHRRCFFRVC